MGPTLQSSASTPTSAQIFYAKNITGGTGTDTIKVTYSGTVASASCVIVEYSGLDQNYPLDSVSAGYSTSGNPTDLMDSGTVAPANANLLVFGGGTSDMGTANLQSGSMFTVVQKNGGSLTEQMVITGNNALQRATVCLNTVGAPCTPTTNGNWVMQMAVFRDASWTVAGGGWLPVRPGQVLYADQFPGVDIGDKINKAYAALAPAGGVIYVPPTTGCQPFTTQIVLNTQNKPATLQGAAGQGSCIQFTPSTGTAVLLDWGQGHLPGAGVRDLAILGSCPLGSLAPHAPSCGSISSVGLTLGGTYGTQSAMIENVIVGASGYGFLTGVSAPGSLTTVGYLTEFINVQANGDNVGVLFPNAGENNNWIGGAISGNNIGLNITSAGSDLAFNKVSFDANYTCAIEMSANSLLQLNDDHFENPQGGAANSNCWMIGTNGSVWWKWGDIFDDNGTTNGVSSPITFGGTFFLFDHVQFQTAGEAISEMINFTANTTADLTPINGNYTAQPLDYIYSGAQGRIRYCPMFGLNATEACTMSYFTQSADKFITNVGAGGPAGASWTSSASAGALPSTCSVGSLASNTGATTASTALYVCYPANTWNAVNVP